MLSKSELRERYKKNIFYDETIATSLTFQILSFLEKNDDQTLKVVAAYLRLSDEIYPDFEFLKTKFSELKWGFPFKHRQEMRFALTKELTQGPWLKEYLEEVEPSLIFVPGLAFSDKGVRLGRGGGFYDKYFSCRKLVKVGVINEANLHPLLPYEKHDILMDYIITEKRIVKI